MTAGWLRLHVPPKKVARTPEEFRSAKQRWLSDRSRERYDKWPEGIRANEAFYFALTQGDIGWTENIRLIEIPEEKKKIPVIFIPRPYWECSVCGYPVMELGIPTKDVATLNCDVCEEKTEHKIVR